MKAKIIAICSVLAIGIVLMCYVVFMDGSLPSFKTNKPQDDKNYAFADPSIQNPNKNNNEQSTEDLKDETPEAAGDLVVNNNNANGENTNGTSGSNNTNSNAKKNKLNSMTSFDFKINGVNITLPMKYGDLKSKMGLVVEKCEPTIAPGASYQVTAFMLDLNNINIDEMLGGEEANISELTKNAIAVLISFENLTSKNTIPIKDATVTSVSVISNPSVVSMSNGVTGKQTLSEIRNTYGTPNNSMKLGMELIYYDIPCKNHNNKSVGLEITADTSGTVKMIRYGTFDPSYESAMDFLLENGEALLNNDMVMRMLTGKQSGDGGGMEDIVEIGGLLFDFLGQG